MPRLLIANRGEIAVRTARAAAAEGMVPVAFTATDEPGAPHLAAAYDAAVAAAYANGQGLDVAAHWEIDDVIDPADTRRWITTLTREAAATPRPPGRTRPHVDTW